MNDHDFKEHIRLTKEMATDLSTTFNEWHEKLNPVDDKRMCAIVGGVATFIAAFVSTQPNPMEKLAELFNIISTGMVNTDPAYLAELLELDSRLPDMPEYGDSLN